MCNISSFDRFRVIVCLYNLVINVRYGTAQEIRRVGECRISAVAYRRSQKQHGRRIDYTIIVSNIYIHTYFMLCILNFYFNSFIFINIYEKSNYQKKKKEKGEKKSSSIVLTQSSCFSQQIRLYYILKKIEYRTQTRVCSIRYCSCYNKLSLTTLEIYSSLLLGHKTVSLRDSGPGVSSMHYTPHFKWTKINFSSPHVP